METKLVVADGPLPVRLDYGRVVGPDAVQNLANMAAESRVRPLEGLEHQ